MSRAESLVVRAGDEQVLGEWTRALQRRWGRGAGGSPPLGAPGGARLDVEHAGAKGLDVQEVCLLTAGRSAPGHLDRHAA
jgi:hypothetical protein